MPYIQISSCVSHVFELAGAGALTSTAGCHHAHDKLYEIRGGPGVGVGAPQFGLRRGLFEEHAKSL